jgi:hypothetical protein
MPAPHDLVGQALRIMELHKAGRIRPGTALALSAVKAAIDRHFSRCLPCRAELDRLDRSDPSDIIPEERACAELRGMMDSFGRIASMVVRPDGSDGPAVMPE